MARQQKRQPLSSSTGRPVPWSKENLRAFWKEIHRVRRERRRHSETVPGQARPSTVENRSAEASLKIGWRDKALDQFMKTLAKKQATADLSRRLRRYVETARGHEAHSARDWTGGARKMLMDWTAERLPELDRKRPESIYRSAQITYDYLATLFRDARADLARREVKIRPADWRPIVRNAWVDERSGQRITDAQADAISVTPTGRIRSPKAMALEMTATLEGHDPQALKRELSRARSGPPAL